MRTSSAAMPRSVARLVITSALAGFVIAASLASPAAQKRAARQRPEPLPEAEVTASPPAPPAVLETRPRSPSAHARPATPTTRSTPRWIRRPRPHRSRDDHLAEHLGEPDERDPPAPLLERLEEHPVHVPSASAVGGTRGRIRRAPARGLLAHHDLGPATPGRGSGPPVDLTSRACDPARRWEPRRPDGGGGAAARPRSRRARPSTCRSPGRRACRARSRAPARSATTTSSAQWFPKIGVLQDTGWNCHQFHAATEFFSDFGIYDVRLTVPNGWVVGATGAERGRRDEGDRTTTHHYYAGGRPRFRLDDEPGLRRADRALRAPRRCRPVSMRLLLQPEHVGQAERHFDATRAALRYYGEWFGPYPYATHHDRRSGVAERRGRHGVPDALHGRHALAGAARRSRSRKA